MTKPQIFTNHHFILKTTYLVSVTKHSKTLTKWEKYSKNAQRCLVTLQLLKLSGEKSRCPSVCRLFLISDYICLSAQCRRSTRWFFLYGPHTKLALVAVLNRDDADDIVPAAALGMMMFYVNAGLRLLHGLLPKGELRRTQSWRASG